MQKKKNRCKWVNRCKKKELDKIQSSSMIKKKKTCSKLRLEGNKGKFLNLTKGIYWKPTAKLILIGERLKAFP